MSVSITTASITELARMGWNYAHVLERAGGRPTSYGGDGPANKQAFYDAIVVQCVSEQGGSASNANVSAAMEDAATPEACFTTIDAL